MGVAEHQRGLSGFDGGGKRDDGAAPFAARRREVSSRYRAQQPLNSGVGGGAREFFPGEPFPRHATGGGGGGGVTDIYGTANSPSPFSSPEVLANLMLWRRKIVGFNTNHVSIVT